jgi:serine/threonine protein kinase
MKPEFGQENKNTIRQKSVSDSNFTPSRRGNGDTGAASARPPGPAAHNLERIGRYELVYPLGQGGMATVYVGHASGLAGFEKLVAIKVIHPHLVQQRQFVHMFLDEARIAAQILHPNVAAVHDVDEEDGLLYMAGELVRGQSLKALLGRARAEGAPVTEAMAAHIGAKICVGLQAAHELTDADGHRLNLVHRDVSPQNVLVSYAGFVKLIDFGVAHAKGRLSHTEAGMIKGKMGYVSPEQLQTKPLDRRSDLFSVGVVLYEMVTGRHPFPGRTGMERLGRIARGQYVPPRDVEPNLSPDLERIILKSLARDRNQRYQTADEMAEDLNAFARARDRSIGPQQLAKLMKYLFSADIAEQDRRLRGFRGRGERDERSGSTPVNPMQSNEGHAWTASGTRAALPSQKRRWLKTTVAAASAAAAIAVGIVALAMFGGDGTALNPTGETTAAASPDAAVVAEREAIPKPAPGVDQPNAQPAGETMRLSFDLTPSEAMIVLDGSRVVAGVNEILLPADGARHEITCKARGYRAQTIGIVADRDREIVFELQPAPPKPRYRKKTGKNPILVPNPY